MNVPCHAFSGNNTLKRKERTFGMKRLVEVISEEDFFDLAQDRSQNFLKIHNYLFKKQTTLTRRFYAHMVEEAEELESFLDDHCARDNKTWYFFGKLVACVRSLGKVAFTLRHLLNRYPFYHANDNLGDRFLKKTAAVSISLDKTIFSLYEEIRQESTRLGLKFPRGGLKDDLFAEINSRKRLPYNIDQEEDLDAKEIMAKISTQYLDMVQAFNDFGWSNLKPLKNELISIVPSKVNEERSREIIAQIHNLQSTYDHYIRHTPIESDDEELKKFRGYISIPMHLLGVVNWLSHIYQRHIQATILGPSQRHISDILADKQILDILINFGLRYADLYLKKGGELASGILSRYIDKETCEIKVPERLGFHLRPASMIAKLAKHHGTKMFMLVDGKEYDASNVLSVTMAAGLIAHKGYKSVPFRGDKKALEDLKLLSDHNYGLDKNGDLAELPPELQYLWA